MSKLARFFSAYLDQIKPSQLVNTDKRHFRYY